MTDQEVTFQTVPSHLMTMIFGQKRTGYGEARWLLQDFICSLFIKCISAQFLNLQRSCTNLLGMPDTLRIPAADISPHILYNSRCLSQTHVHVLKACLLNHLNVMLHGDI